jgi:hypothetical protein
VIGLAAVFAAGLAVGFFDLVFIGWAVQFVSDRTNKSYTRPATIEKYELASNSYLILLGGAPTFTPSSHVMNETPNTEGPEKAPERRVKSVNFTDQALYDYASQRADNLYGGNFSGYVTALIERDRSMAESRRTFHDLEAKILEIIEPYGGRLGKESDPFDFEVPKLDVVIEARSRFPRERHLEYQLLSSMQKVSFTSPLTRVIVTYPTDLADAEKERFRQFETAGIENLRACDLAEMVKFLASLVQPDTESLEDALLDQDNAGKPKKSPQT